LKILASLPIHNRRSEIRDLEGGFVGGLWHVVGNPPETGLPSSSSLNSRSTRLAAERKRPLGESSHRGNIGLIEASRDK
jgi:hypothetical protein